MASEFPHKGNLSDVGLPRILTFIQRNALSGTLTLHRNDQSKSIYCRNGDIIFAVSKYPDDRLGEFLLKNGKITLRQFEESARAVLELKKRQGSILVERGYLSPRDLVWAVRQQVQDIVLSLFTWIGGEFQFDRDVLPTSEVVTLKMSTGDLIYQGIRRINDWVRLRRDTPAPEKILRITTDPMALYQRVVLSNEERKLLSLINGRRTLMDLFDDSPLSPFDTLKLIHFMVATDIAEEVEIEAGSAAEPEAESEPVSRKLDEILTKEDTDFGAREKILAARRAMDNQNHYEVLGILNTASKGEIRQAYFRQSRQYHPDRHFSSGLEDVKTPLDELFHRITVAYETLMNDEQRQSYDFQITEKKVRTARGRISEPAKPEALAALAKAALAKGDLRTAAYYMEEALKLDPESAAYHSLMAQVLSRIRSRRKEAEFHYKSAIKKEPYKMENFLGLSSLYREAGLPQRAIRICEEALLWDPGNAKVLQELQRLKNKTE